MTTPVQDTTMHKWFTRVWNENNAEAIRELMAPTSIAHGINGQPDMMGPEGFAPFFEDFTSKFKDINILVDEVIAKDNLECAIVTVNAIDKASGKAISFPGMCMAKIENGQIAEAWNSFDFDSLEQQLKNNADNSAT